MSLENLIQNLSKNQTIKTATQIREIVPIERWLESPFYVGPDGVKIYDIWKTHIAKVINGGFSEVVLSGSLGSGKSTVADYLLDRKIYELSCYDIPAFLFNMMATTIITALYFSITMSQAMNTGFGKIRRIIDSTPYYQKYYQRNKDKDSVIEFPHMHIMYGSGVGHQIGLDVAFSVMDESNFLGQDKTHIQDYDKATQLYTAITNRRLNRFVIGEKDLGLSIIASSAADPTSFVEGRIRAADELKAKGKDVIYVANVASIDVKRSQYSEEEFCVFLGTDMIDPCIVEDNDTLLKVLHAMGHDVETVDWRLNYIPIIKRHLPDAIAYKFKFVPETLRQMAELNMHQFIQDTIGSSIEADIKLFKNRDAYKDCTAGVKNLFIKDTVILSGKDEIPLSEYFDFKFDNPHLPRFIHVDQAVVRDANQKIQNRLGMACAHVSKFERIGGQVIPYITVDFMLAVNPPERPDEIPLWKIEQFLIWLHEMKLNMGKVTFDQFQSRTTIQKLNDLNNIKSERYSVDSSDSDWLTLVKLFYQRHVRMPYHKIFVEEFFKIEHNTVTHRCNHPSGCFTGNTKVSLVDGRELSFFELEQEHKRGKINYVYSIDNITGKITPKVIKNVWKTKDVKQLIKVTLDNDQEVFCTADHLWMLRDGQYKEAKDLQVKESLMPLYRKVSSKGLEGYRLYYEPFDKKWHYEHRQFAIYGIKEKRHVVHHLNYNKLDNTPERVAKNIEHMKETKSKRKKINHKIKCIEIINNYFDISVYDLQVEDGDNFALSAEIFVHNSFKDLSDATVAACANSIMSTNVGGWNLSKFASDVNDKSAQQNLYEMIKQGKIF